MSENAPSDSDTQETDSSPSSSEKLESPKNGGTQKKMTEYEKQRAKRIEENRARMEALGLRKMACSVMGSGRIAKEKKREAKGKMREEDDEEYRPEEEGDEEGLSSSSGEDEENEGTSGGRKSKVLSLSLSMFVYILDIRAPAMHMQNMKLDIRATAMRMQIVLCKI